MSKQRPSNSRRRPDLNHISGRQPQVFHNSYTRAGRRFQTAGWAVKLQFQGRRRTFSLRAKDKSLAVIEAKAINDTLRTEGWAAALRNHGRQASAANDSSKAGVEYWRERLLVRRYHFPATGSIPDLSVKIEHAGVGYWFPLGSTQPGKAAAQATEIYHTVVNQGWNECCRLFSRELIIGFEWCSNPVLWTYATIHTLLETMAPTPAGKPSAASAFRVLIVEEDAGVRRALEWCINRQSGFRCVTCDSPERFAAVMELQRPQLVLLNRNLAERLGFASPGQMAVIRGAVPAMTYSVAVDGDSLFVSTPGGAVGYLIKRIRPERLLEPILGPGGLPDLAVAEYLPRARSYFKDLTTYPTGKTDPGLDKLTRREAEVLALLSKGRVDKEIAQALGISAWTVHGHIKNIFERLRVRTRTEAVIRYLEK